MADLSLKQFIDHLITEGDRRDRTLYLSFDEGAVLIEDVIAEFQTRMGVEIADAGRVYLFRDEIRKLACWQNQVKYYYDTYPNLKFFVSGSSSLFLRRGAEESLAGRIFLFKLPVLSFVEFLRLEGEEDMVRKPEVFKESLTDQVLQYVRRPLPEIVTADEPFIDMYRGSIIDKIVYEDLPWIFPIEYGDALKRIRKIVAAHPGILIIPISCTLRRCWRGIARLLTLPVPYSIPPCSLLDLEPEECRHPAKRIEPISRLKL